MSTDNSVFFRFPGGFRTIFMAVLCCAALFSCKGGDGNSNDEDGRDVPVPPTTPVTPAAPRAPGLYAGTSESPEAGTDTLMTALTWLDKNLADLGEYTIVINENELCPASTLHYDDKTVRITLEGEGGTRTVQLGEKGSLFTVGKNVELQLGNGITLQGIDNNIAPLVNVLEGGMLEVAAGSVITGNTNTNTGMVAGGINIAEKGQVVITGGTVSENQGTYGGGIRVNANATLVMWAGEIINNRASSGATGGGGGIQIRGVVTLNGGHITGNTASGTNSVDGYGGGIGILAGELTIDGAEISGNQGIGPAGGGGVYVSAATVTFKSGVIADNTTTSTSYPLSSNLHKVSGTFTNESGQTLSQANGFLGL